MEAKKIYSLNNFILIEKMTAFTSTFVLIIFHFTVTSSNTETTRRRKNRKIQHSYNVLMSKKKIKMCWRQSRIIQLNWHHQRLKITLRVATNDETNGKRKCFCVATCQVMTTKLCCSKWKYIYIRLQVIIAKIIHY